MSSNHFIIFFTVIYIFSLIISGLRFISTSGKLFAKLRQLWWLFVVSKGISIRIYPHFFITRATSNAVLIWLTKLWQLKKNIKARASWMTYSCKTYKDVVTVSFVLGVLECQARIIGVCVWSLSKTCISVATAQKAYGCILHDSRHSWNGGILHHTLACCQYSTKESSQ